MAAEEETNSDFYAVMGLKKECTQVELRNAYKKLAMKWHPDRCSASGNPKNMEAAKKKFQAIQQAYSVLSDGNKRFLYDVGIYDCNDDDDKNGMGDFLDEMVAMMNTNKSNEKRNESFEDLQVLFKEIFHSDAENLGSSSSCSTTPPTHPLAHSGAHCTSNKRNSSEMSSCSLSVESAQFEGFSIGVGRRGNIELGRATTERTRRRAGDSRMERKKQKISTF